MNGDGSSGAERVLTRSAVKKRQQAEREAVHEGKVMKSAALGEWPAWTRDEDVDLASATANRTRLEDALNKRTLAELVQFAEEAFGLQVNKKTALRVLVKDLCDCIQHLERSVVIAQNSRSARRYCVISRRSLIVLAFVGVLLALLLVPCSFFFPLATETRGAFVPSLVSCCATNLSSSYLVRRLVSAAQQVASGHLGAGAPHSLVAFESTAQKAREQLEAFARLRFPSPACDEGRVIRNGHQLDEGTVLKQLRMYPDSLVLVDWINGFTNLDVLKRVLDSRCALENCQDITRDASVFIIVTNLSESGFLNRTGGVDIVARTTEKSLL
jgi:hypothetical protein